MDDYRATFAHGFSEGLFFAADNLTKTARTMWRRRKEPGAPATETVRLLCYTLAREARTLRFAARVKVS